MHSDKLISQRSNLKSLGHALFISLLLPATVIADTTADCNTGTGTDSTEWGVSANASGNRSTAIGFFSRSGGSTSTAIAIGGDVDDDDKGAEATAAGATDNY